MYDFGSKKNQKFYKSKNPPDYNLKNTQVPVALFWAENDWFANPRVRNVFFLSFLNLSKCCQKYNELDAGNCSANFTQDGNVKIFSVDS